MFALAPWVSAALLACSSPTSATSAVNVSLGDEAASGEPGMREVAAPAHTSKPRELAIAWEHDVDAAMSRASRERRPLLVAACAEWSTDCLGQVALFNDATVVRAAQSYVALAVDLTEDTPEANALVARFHLRGVPSIVLVASDGRERQLGRVMDATDLVEALGEFVSR